LQEGSGITSEWSEECVRSPGTEVMDGCEPLCRSWGLNLGPLQGHTEGRGTSTFLLLQELIRTAITVCSPLTVSCVNLGGFRKTMMSFSEEKVLFLLPSVSVLLKFGTMGEVVVCGDEVVFGGEVVVCGGEVVVCGGEVVVCGGEVVFVVVKLFWRQVTRLLCAEEEEGTALPVDGYSILGAGNVKGSADFGESEHPDWFQQGSRAGGDPSVYLYHIAV
ncbi:hypothetical protein STEG23_004798, partial [Scotinomys teguina]